MIITVTLPSRRRPALLRQALDGTASLVKDKHRVVISLALDADDAESTEFHSLTSVKGVSVITTVEPRERSLGAKYNRAARAAPADIYLQHADDQCFKTPDWDEVLRDYAARYDGEPGLVYIGAGAGVMPGAMAVTAAFAEALGGMFPEHFPQWWHETWNDEIGWMTGRILRIPPSEANVENLGGRGRTMSIRDVNFWADFFNRTRPIRAAQAQAILDASGDKPFRLKQLAQQAPDLYRWFVDRESALLSPEGEDAVIRQMAAPLEPGDDERLDAAREEAKAFLARNEL
jgi:hypothetical protein